MDIYPIGTVSAASNLGTLDSISYKMFEPNAGCDSNVVYTNLITRFEQQSILTRKKAEPYISISYDYENILAKEYNQIDHFIYKKGESLTSFYVVDWSRGFTPSNIASAGGYWVVSIDNTRLFSSIANRKANNVFIWNGAGSFKEGTVATIVANTSISVNVTGSQFGALARVTASQDAMVYPMYTVYANQNTMVNFKKTFFFDSDIAEDNGWMKSGNITFMGKYKV